MIVCLLESYRERNQSFSIHSISAVLKWTFKWDLLGNFKICHIFCLNCRKVRKLFDMVEWVFCFLFPLQDFCQRWDTNFKTEGENWGKKYTIVNVSLIPVSIAVWRFRTSDQNKRLLQFFGDDLYPYFCDRNTLLHVFHTCFSLLQPLFCSYLIPGLAMNHWNWIFWVRSLRSLHSYGILGKRSQVLYRLLEH